MFLTQPPFTACKLRIYLDPGDYDWEVMYDKSGIRLGHIADLVAKLLQQSDRFGQMSEEAGCESLRKISKIMVSFRAEVDQEQQDEDSE